MTVQRYFSIFFITILAVIIMSCGANKKLVMENQDLSSSLAAARAQNEELRKQLEDTQATLAGTEGALKDLKGELEVREKKLSDLQFQLDMNTEQIDDLGARFGDVREDLQKSFAEIDSLGLTVQELQSTMRASENEMVNQIAQLSKRKQELEKQAIDLKSQITRATKQNADLAFQISNLKAEINDQQSEIKDLKDERTTLIRTISDLNATFKARTDDLSSQVAQLRGKNEGLEKQISDLNATLEAAARRNEQQSETIEGYRKTIQEQAFELEELGARVNTLETEKQNLESKIAVIEQDRAMMLQAEEQEKQKLKSTYEELLASLKNEVGEKTIEIQNYRDALTINIMDKIFFDSGKALVKPDGLHVLDRIAPILKNLQGKIIRIEGHTDDVPIGPKIKTQYPSNWELGAARASAVARYFIDKHGIDPTRIVAISYSFYRPILPNTSNENRSKNRRIEIVLTDRSLYEMMELKESGGTE